MTWIFEGWWELMEGDTGVRWMEMRQMEANEGCGVCGLDPGGVGAVTWFCTPVAAVISFWGRLCLSQKIYYWKFIKIPNRISQWTSLHMLVQEQHSGCFLAKFTDHYHWPGPRKPVWWAETQKRMHWFHKKTLKQTGSMILFTYAQFAYLPFRCSLLQPEI